MDGDDDGFKKEVSSFIHHSSSIWSVARNASTFITLVSCLLSSLPGGIQRVQLVLGLEGKRGKLDFVNEDFSRL
jgi:hypothetical protein